MNRLVWNTFAIIVGAAPMQVVPGTGRLQYAALKVARRGGSLSYTLGIFETAVRLPDATEPRVLEDVPGFAQYPHIQPGFLAQYAALFQVAVANEQDHKARAVRLSVEDYKEQGRRQTKNPAPQRSQRRAS